MLALLVFRDALECGCFLFFVAIFVNATSLVSLKSNCFCNTLMGDVISLS